MRFLNNILNVAGFITIFYAKVNARSVVQSSLVR